MADHPDFQSLPWVRDLLADPNLTMVHNFAPNGMFHAVLYKPGAIEAHLPFSRPCREPNAPPGDEQCLLMSVGGNLDGMKGRAHGETCDLRVDL